MTIRTNNFAPLEEEKGDFGMYESMLERNNNVTNEPSHDKTCLLLVGRTSKVQMSSEADQRLYCSVPR